MFVYESEKNPQVLTPAGWVSILDVSVGDVIMAWDPLTEGYQFEPIKSKEIDPFYDGEVYHIKLNTLDVKLTSDHCMWQKRQLKLHSDPDWIPNSLEYMYTSVACVFPLGGIHKLDGGQGHSKFEMAYLASLALRDPKRMTWDFLWGLTYQNKKDFVLFDGIQQWADTHPEKKEWFETLMIVCRCQNYHYGSSFKEAFEQSHVKQNRQTKGLTFNNRKNPEHYAGVVWQLATEQSGMFLLKQGVNTFPIG